MKHHLRIWGGLACVIAAEQLKPFFLVPGNPWGLAVMALFLVGNWCVLSGMYLYGRADERKGRP